MKSKVLAFVFFFVLSYSYFYALAHSSRRLTDYEKVSFFFKVLSLLFELL